MKSFFILFNCFECSGFHQVEARKITTLALTRIIFNTWSIFSFFHKNVSSIFLLRISLQGTP